MSTFLMKNSIKIFEKIISLPLPIVNFVDKIMNLHISGVITSPSHHWLQILKNILFI